MQPLYRSLRSLSCGLALLLGAGTALAQPTNPIVPSSLLGTIPLAKHPDGQKMMAETARRLALVDVGFSFLDKTYENDAHVRDPLTGKQIRTSCVRFKASSGFRFRVDVPTFELDERGLTITQNIARIGANALRFRFQLGPCVESTAGFGVSVSDINFVYKARPLLKMDNGICTLVYNQDPEQLRVAVGGFNITGVQNDLDKLAKDALREGVNLSLDGPYGSLVRKELTLVTVQFCGKR